MTNLEGLRHDTATLYRLVGNISEFCARRGGPLRYPRPSEEFFEYIVGLAGKTLSYLDRFAENAPAEDNLFHIYRQKLWTVRSVWTNLNKIVRSTVDADTLHVPVTLVDALAEIVRQIPGAEAARFAVFHTQDVNYYFLNPNIITRLVSGLSTIIPDSADFPEDLGLIGIPYAQSSCLFINTLVAHEMGHYVYQKSDVNKEVVKYVTQALVNAFNGAAPPLDYSQLSWAAARLICWAEELFCDLWAITLTGPAYSFAYIDLFDLPRILDPGLSQLNLECPFSESHPAHVFRLKQHADLLKALNWWEHISSQPTHYSEVIKRAAGVDDSAFTFTSSSQPKLCDGTLTAFFEAVPAIHQSVKDLTSSVTAIRGPNGREANIHEYLARGIVPSTITTEKEVTHPNFVDLVNAGYHFQVGRLDDLINNIRSQDLTSVKVRAEWLNRVELWTQKAIEDHRLIAHEKTP